MRIRAWIRSFFAFSRKETNAFLILLPLLLIIVFSEPIYQAWYTAQPSDYSSDKKVLDSLVAQWKEQERKSKPPEGISIPLFDFDPNKATKDEFLKLEFPEPIVTRILNYRSKGGKFQTKSDLLKIYGMDSSLYKKLFAHILLPEKLKNNQVELTAEKKFAPKILQDLNQADTTALIKVYGLGSKLANRIIKYREKLGGFLSTEQLREVYGLDSARIHQVESSFTVKQEFTPRLLDINGATEKELAVHPYIGYKIAKAIITYRFQHGKFQSIEELRKITLLREEAFLKMKPYLSLNP